MNLVKTGRWIYVYITLLYVPPVYYVYYGQLHWIKISESESQNALFKLSHVSVKSDTFMSEVPKINFKNGIRCGCHWLQKHWPTKSKNSSLGFLIFPWEKKWPSWLLTVSSPWAHVDQNGHSQPWLSRDLGRDWAVTQPWLSRDHTEDAVIELWRRRDWAVTSPSRDWVVIIGPGAVTTVVTVSSRWAYCELTVTIFFSHGFLATTI